VFEATKPVSAFASGSVDSFMAGRKHFPKIRRQ
jgi:hypothetical protein